MNVTCAKCQKRYSIADEKVRGKTVKVRCRQCQNLITVQGPSEAAVEPAPKPLWEDESTRAMPALDLKAAWFAMLKGKQDGPFDVLELEARVKAKEIGLRTHVWRQGLAEWQRAGEVPELARLFAGVTVTPAEPAPAPSPELPFEEPGNDAPQKDVAIAAQLPAPEITQRPEAQSALGSLFDDSSSRLEPAAKQEEGPFDSAEKTGEMEQLGAGADPFAALGPSDPLAAPDFGEATSFIITQAGVNKRNPPWKIALFIGAGLLVPMGLLYVLSTLRIVPLEVTRVNEQGQEVKESVFSREGVSGLKSLLTGGANKPAPKTKVASANLPRVQKTDNAIRGAEARTIAEIELPGGTKVTQDLRTLYDEKVDRGPKKRKDEPQVVAGVQGGLKDEDVSKVVAQFQPSFQNCIEQELRRNPTFKGGKIHIIATVGASGLTTRAEIDKKEIDRSTLGECLKSRAKKMIFPPTGDTTETEVQIPLILTATL